MTAAFLPLPSAFSNRRFHCIFKSALTETALPDPMVDPELEKRPAYQEGSLTDTPYLSRYDD
jgi:hypothetical protein